VSGQANPDVGDNVVIQSTNLENESWERGYEVPEPAEESSIKPQ